MKPVEFNVTRDLADIMFVGVLYKRINNQNPLSHPDAADAFRISRIEAFNTIPSTETKIVLGAPALSINEDTGVQLAALNKIVETDPTSGLFISLLATFNPDENLQESALWVLDEASPGVAAWRAKQLMEFSKERDCIDYAEEILAREHNPTPNLNDLNKLQEQVLLAAAAVYGDTAEMKIAATNLIIHREEMADAINYIIGAHFTDKDARVLSFVKDVTSDSHASFKEVLKERLD